MITEVRCLSFTMNGILKNKVVMRETKKVPCEKTPISFTSLITLVTCNLVSLYEMQGNNYCHLFNITLSDTEKSIKVTCTKPHVNFIFLLIY